MSYESSPDYFDSDMRDVAAPFRPLPWWLADRLLRDGEKVAWVYGPALNPSWERYVTHPSLFIYTLGFGALCVGACVLHGGPKPGSLPLIAGLFAGFLVVLSIIVLGIANGYFTRLVVTNRRLLILQGYEAYRKWSLEDLPISLIRYSAKGASIESRSIDLNALKNMLGGSSDKIVGAKSIMELSKRLERIKKGERPE
jgi:hypothetical protein